MKMWRRLLAWATTTAMIASGTGMAVSSPHPHGPVISCNARGANRSGAAEAYAPSSCYLSTVGPGGQGYGSLATLYGFSRVTWSHWGAKTAAGRGINVFCNNGCRTTKITVTAYGLRRNLHGTAIEAYSRIRVSWRSQIVPIVGQRPSTVYYRISGGSLPAFDVLPS
jgi:hypothetical protein